MTAARMAAMTDVTWAAVMDNARALTSAASMAEMTVSMSAVWKAEMKGVRWAVLTVDTWGVSMAGYWVAQQAVPMAA